MDTKNKFNTGFNNGYILAKYEPSLLTNILKSLLSNQDYILGLFSGKKQNEIEMSKTLLDDISRIRSETFEKDFDRDF